MIEDIKKHQICLDESVIRPILGKEYSQEQLDNLEELCVQYYNHALNEVDIERLANNLK